MATGTAEQATAANSIVQATTQMRRIAQEVSKAIGEQGNAARDIIKAAQATTKTAAQVRKASGEQATSARQITQAADSMRRGAASTSRALAEQATAADQIVAATGVAERHDRQRQPGDERAGDRRRRRSAPRSNSMRRETEQASRALAEQARGLKDMVTATQNTAKQMKLITHANREHSGVAGRLLDQLRDIRADHRAQRARGQGDPRRRHRSARARRGAGAASSTRQRAGERHGPNGAGMNDADGVRSPAGSRPGTGAPHRHPHDRRDLVVTSWDAALASMTGIAAADAVGRPLTAIVPDLESRGLLAHRPRARWSPARRRCWRRPSTSTSFPAPPLEPSSRYDRMQQRVALGAAGRERAHGRPAITIEDVTERLELEHQLASELRDADAGGAAARDRTARRR